MSKDLCILVPVWHGYRWLAPLTQSLLDKHWPAHPPVLFAGLTPDEAGSLAHVPVTDLSRRTNLSWMVGDGAGQIAGMGFRRAYLIAEEHVPLGPCHQRHLNETLPAWMDELHAVYISLMGWDNRRYPSKSPLLSAKHGRMMHLRSWGDPRFHLHPALWRLDVLCACSELAQCDEAKRGSAWHFEKINDKVDAKLRDEWKQACYQIAARRLALDPSGAGSTILAIVEHFVFNKLMALYPHIRPRRAANAFASAMGFDNFFCRGPYPMFYSGLMVKGGLNPYAARFLRKTHEGRCLLQEVTVLRDEFFGLDRGAHRRNGF